MQNIIKLTFFQKWLLFGLLTIVASIDGLGQRKITGIIVDAKTDETIIGATVHRQGTHSGTISDINGAFSLEVPADSCTLMVSFVSYQSATIPVPSREGKLLELGVVRLQPKQELLTAVEVVADANRSSEAGLMAIKLRSAAMLDGVSAETIKLAADGSAASAAKRVSSIYVADNKYLQVRGLGDRYSKVLINGLVVPALDPDKNALQLDLIPSGVISNMTISKTFLPDMPAGFAGGLLNIDLSKGPDSAGVHLNMGVDYSPQHHFRSEFLHLPAGSADFVALGAVERSAPGTEGLIPSPLSGHSPEEVWQFTRTFDPALAPVSGPSFVDYKFGLGFSGQLNRSKTDQLQIRYFADLAYSSQQRNINDYSFNQYQISSESMVLARSQKGQLGETEVKWSMLGGLSASSKSTSYSLLLLHLQNGVSRAGLFDMESFGNAPGQSDYRARSATLEYLQRGLSGIMFSGSHDPRASDWEVNYNAGGFYSTSQDPDIRKTTFTLTATDTLFLAGSGGNPSRAWRDLSEINVSARIDAKRDLHLFGREANLTFGLSQIYKDRHSDIQLFDMRFFGRQQWQGLDFSQVLRPQNLYPNGPQVYYMSANATPNPNAYSSEAWNSGAHISFNFQPAQNLKVIAGLRLEKFLQLHSGNDIAYATSGGQRGILLDRAPVLNTTDVFPSVNLLYDLTRGQKLRVGFSQTIARPTFKELSFAQILDPVTNSIFNGGLHRYEGWNGDLKPAYITNFDLRWEHSTAPGELISVGGFYKSFQNPIELVRIASQPGVPEYQPRNVGMGSVVGIELEYRKNLKALHPGLKALQIQTNIALLHSSIALSAEESKSSDKGGEGNRPMAGQSPYIFNLGLSYQNPRLDLSGGLFYNVSGPTLLTAGNGLYPDLYQSPFHSLNLSLRKRVGNHILLEATAKNLLNQREKEVVRYAGEEFTALDYSKGRMFSLSVKLSL